MLFFCKVGFYEKSQEITAVFLLQSMMVREETRDNSCVFAAVFDVEGRARR